MTVAELSERLTAAEEAHWIAKYRDEPFGDERVDIGLAQLAQILWNSNVKKEKTRKLFSFLPFYRKKVQPTDSDVSETILSTFSNINKEK